MIQVIEVLGQLVLLACLISLFVGLVGVYIYVRTLDGLLTGDGWLARLLNRVR